jgi:4-hydroxymandelate oxidase
MTSVPLDRIVALGGSVWFQLYWLQDRAQTFDLVQHAQDAGCEALMLTVDTPWMGRRRRDLRNGFAVPDGVRAVELGLGPGSSTHRAESGRSALAAHSAQAFSHSLTWSDLEALRSRSRLPLILKGVLDPEDAALAVQHGADAVVVSNHGGRQLDGAVPAIDVLEAVCRAVDGRAEVLVDGAIRSGTDILRALALGADGVLVGRPLIWGLATDGANGAGLVLELLAAELRDALGLAGCDTPRAARALRTLSGPPAPAPDLSGT